MALPRFLLSTCSSSASKEGSIICLNMKYRTISKPQSMLIPAHPPKTLVCLSSFSNKLLLGKPQFLGVRDRAFVVSKSSSLGTKVIKKSVIVEASSLPIAGCGSTSVASTLFTFGTIFVMPFYTLMIFAPHMTWTRKLMEGDIPYLVLGALYIYLLVKSWTPGTISLMFSNKYFLPELPGIAKMFSSTLTVASAWIHLLAVDLFSGRQVYLDGLQHSVETRHSLLLCFMFCPVGIFCHIVTKALLRGLRRSKDEKDNAIDMATIQ